jgi:hypothetical protein
MGVRKTNEEFVADLMRYSPRGVLGQVFVVEAIRFYAEQVVAQGPQESDGVQFIDPKAWYDIAQDVLKRVKKNYEEDPSQCS